MTTCQPAIKVYASPEEKARIAASARACRLSVSAFARTLMLGFQPGSALDLERMDKILAISADLGRLGGLLKMLLTNDERLNDMGREMGVATIDGALMDIRATQALLLDLVDSLVAKSRRSERSRLGGKA